MSFRDIQSPETILEPFWPLLLQNMHLRGPFLETGCAGIDGNDDEDTSLLLKRLVSNIMARMCTQLTTAKTLLNWTVIGRVWWKKDVLTVYTTCQ